ncbi:MAG TPA: EamA family transporter, partial [Proteiniclasticum sp.]|nr:EamA family transporter [Proteiniclasticum sp.]
GVADLNPFVATEIRIFAGILGFILIITVTKKWTGFFNTFKNKSVMKGITIGSIFGPVVGVSLSLMAVKYTSTAIASTLMAIVPILIIPVSIIFFKEKVKANEVLGALIGVLGVAVIFMG